MKTVKFFQAISVLLIITFISATNINAQEGSADQAAMMKAWQEYMTPGNIHKMMAKDVGEWKASVTQWMDPAQPPTKSEGTCTNEMLLGGRYLQSKYTATMMGMPMNGIGIMGYDNAKKLFQSYWIDNMGTGTMLVEGPLDETTKTITMTGKMFDPISKTEIGVKQVNKWIDDNHSVMELYMVQNGKEMKNLQVDYERK
ncbi:MAG: DUF1579 domain-containing protein [Ignavibacteriales bacterium]|nr:DUF1579 domain-containing protein [Ignavibacteriales bacterium]